MIPPFLIVILSSPYIFNNHNGIDMIRILHVFTIIILHCI